MTDVTWVKTDDSVGLKVEVTGTGTDVLFLHEFSGDMRSWEGQVRALSRQFRCITFSARGFPGSDVPDDLASYSQERAVQDALQVLDVIGSESAHVVGLSMGAFTSLHLALERPSRVRSAVVASCGYGADTDPETFREEMNALAGIYREQGSQHLAALTARSPYRLAFRESDPRGFREWVSALEEHDPVGAANTIAGVQANRPTLREMAEQMASLERPVLFMAGDEDDPCLEVNLLAKRSSPLAALAVLPRTSHTINLEDPGAFNRHLLDFFSRVESGRYEARLPESMVGAGGWVR